MKQDGGGRRPARKARHLDSFVTSDRLAGPLADDRLDRIVEIELGKEALRPIPQPGGATNLIPSADKGDDVRWKVGEPGAVMVEICGADKE